MGAPADGHLPVRVVGPAALKPLMAYGGTVLDLRPEFQAGAGPAAEGAVAERLASRLATQVAHHTAQLILLLADDPEPASRVAARLQRDGYPCVVVVNAGRGPAAAAPGGTPG